jgi:hypothetical protein
MDVVAAERWRDDLAGFTEDVFASLTPGGRSGRPGTSKGY